MLQVWSNVKATKWGGGGSGRGRGLGWESCAFDVFADIWLYGLVLTLF